ncbi:MAG: nucleotidyltransferase family protein, partial [Pyrinomonadaceae bacterium]
RPESIPTTITDSNGALVAAALSGSWRQTPPAFRLNASQLEQVAPLLLGSGASALGWWSVRQSSLHSTPPALAFRQAYRLLTIEDALHERKIKKAIGLLRSCGIEPLLVKGWAVARLYPERALRPYGDIDLCVRPQEFRAAEEVLKSDEAKDCWVDLHDRFSELSDRSLDDLYARAQLVQLDEIEVRVAGPEDHLALLAIHWLKHGAWRPLGLCDIGMAVESRPKNFDWGICLGNNPRRAKWVTSTIALAHQLLGAQMPEELAERQVDELPRWLAPAVLKEWETPYAREQAPMKHSQAMSKYLRNPHGLWKGLRERWPNPIKATIDMDWPLNEMPRWPFQIGYCISRLKQFLTNF